MSSKEIKEKYPDIYDLLNRWRKQEIEACELNIPGMEPPEVFWSRIFNFIKTLPKNKINIVVCTRSVMVMVANLIKGNTPQLGGEYRHVNIGNCDIIAFKLNKDNSFLLLD
ncbi:MAG: histidine phosphatase family protein [Lachnospiraceae bacterium]|nr:histidine phosphatase family protein [Lachnospiraceae bacterium]